MAQGYIESPADLGRVVAAVRRENGLSQDALAERLGVSQRYLSELERGRAKVFDARFISVLGQLGIRLMVETE
ncbi:helix-turn-helix domain-containing protein [Subtercola sp. Z020]|uniref:helix-turn-helix domain-containing protein n=1 Tax=Subtercola sp. Z020 TaxID=2080582 RepID=UPI00130D7160|nr:helix-turn-helix transcriptional regulator [Subtercola sp. Z020]